jgi:hypothetical protein
MLFHRAGRSSQAWSWMKKPRKFFFPVADGSLSGFKQAARDKYTPKKISQKPQAQL